MKEDKGEEKRKEKQEERKLRTKQLDLLYVVFSFRFATANHLADYFNQNVLGGARRRLEEMRHAGYLDRFYDGDYKIQGKPAEYYLTPSAAPILRAAFSRISKSELHLLYKRPTVSRRFIERSLAILATRNRLADLYGSRLDFVAKPLLNTDNFDYLPRPLPDAYLTLDPDTAQERASFLEYFDDAVSIGIHGRQILKYINYRESGKWDETELPFPTIILVCESPALLKRAEKRVRYFERQHGSGLVFRLINLSALQAAGNVDDQVWIDPVEKTKTAL